MVEGIVLGVFAASLFVCIGLDWSVLTALLFGFILFFAYGIYKKHTGREMLSYACSGIRTVRNILVTFVLIGMITAIWRAGGTIPFIVYYSTKICHPRAMVCVTFLLCCLISFLTGTAFGTAATMGVICVTMANSMGIPILYSGGAVPLASVGAPMVCILTGSYLYLLPVWNYAVVLIGANKKKTKNLPFSIN